MNNQDKWLPSKFVYRKGKLMGSRDSSELGIASRLVADIVAELYDKNIKQHAKKKLIDLGCGKAPLYHVYKDYVEEIVCVDWANTQHKNEYLDFECDLTKRLPFENGEFDTIILSDVLEHIPQPEQLWKEMARILSTDGKIIVNVPFYYQIHASPYDYYRYTEFALRRFVDISGLKLVQLDAIGGSPEILADIFAKHFQYIPWVGKGGAIIIQYIVWLFLRTSLGKKISRKTGQKFPLGYFLIAEKPADGSLGVDMVID